MKLAYKIYHDRDKFEDIFADAPAKDASMLRALMVLIDALTRDRRDNEKKNHYVKRTAFAESLLSTIALGIGTKEVNTDAFGKQSYLVEGILRTAHSQKAVAVWARMTTDGYITESKSRTRMKIIGIDKDGKQTELSMDDVPDKVKAKILKELG